MKPAGDGLAVAPLDAVFDSAVSDVAIAVYLAVISALLIWGLSSPKRRVVVTAMLFGGAMTSSIEPLLDVTSGALHPLVGQHPVFTFMGRSIPVWVVICYAIYYGGFGSLNLLAFSRGCTMRRVWLWYLVPLLGDVLLEEVMLHFNLYYYYGNQPFLLVKFPLYQAAGNSTGELLGVTVLFLMRHRLVAWRWFVATALVMPLCGVMGFNAVCWPSAYAVHSTWNHWTVQACGVLTWGFAALLVYMVSLIVATDSPLRRSGKLVLA